MRFPAGAVRGWSWKHPEIKQVLSSKGVLVVGGDFGFYDDLWWFTIVLWWLWWFAMVLEFCSGLWWFMLVFNGVSISSNHVESLWHEHNIWAEIDHHDVKWSSGLNQEKVHEPNPTRFANLEKHVCRHIYIYTIYTYIYIHIMYNIYNIYNICYIYIYKHMYIQILMYVICTIYKVFQPLEPIWLSIWGLTKHFEYAMGYLICAMFKTISRSTLFIHPYISIPILEIIILGI